jgi:hypothetical protein
MEHRKPEVLSDTIERRLERLERDSRRWKAMTTLELIKRSRPSLLFFDQEEHVVWQAL